MFSSLLNEASADITTTSLKPYCLALVFLSTTELGNSQKAKREKTVCVIISHAEGRSSGLATNDLPHQTPYILL